MKSAIRSMRRPRHRLFNHGRVRSRVVRAADARAGRDLQVVLNVAEGRGPARWHGLNQVAFGVRDVCAAVRAARRAGVGMLRVPANYYTDLAARFAIDRGLLALLREHDLFYDRTWSADGAVQGEFLHAYTRTVAGRFYVELVELRPEDDGRQLCEARRLFLSGQGYDAEDRAREAGADVAYRETDVPHIVDPRLIPGLVDWLDKRF